MTSPTHQSPSSSSKSPANQHKSTAAPIKSEVQPLNAASVEDLDIEQLTPSQILMLQRTHGNHYVQRLLDQNKHKADKPAAPQDQPAISASQVDPETVQRRLGFEFEEANWRAWKVENNKVRSAKRKEELHTGTNFKMEGDDTPGDKLANIEFVTEPFDATPGGLNDYLRTMGEVLYIVRQITPLAGKPGPGSDQDVKTAKKPPTYVPLNYVNQAQHNLNKPDVALSKGTAAKDGSFKMQGTSGISLGDIPKVMEMFGITPDEKKMKGMKDGGRGKDDIKQRMNIDENKYNSLDQSLTRKAPARKIQATQGLLGGAPSVARLALRDLGGELTYSIQQKASINNTPQKLLGFLSLIAMNIKGLGIKVDGPAKYRLPFLGRNNFVTLFNELDPLQQAALSSNSASAFISAVIAANNGLSLVKGDNDKTAATPLVNGFPTLQDLTIGVWLKGITTGTDYLDPTKIATLMNGQKKLGGLMNKYSSKDVETSKDALESFATLPAVDPNGGNPLAVLENRGLTSGPLSDFPMDQAITVGYNYLKFFVDLEAGGVDNNYNYPTTQIVEQQQAPPQQPQQVDDQVEDVVIE